MSRRISSRVTRIGPAGPSDFACCHSRDGLMVRISKLRTIETMPQIRPRTLKKKERKAAGPERLQRRSVPRIPRQERGRARYEAMLDAAELFLEGREIEEIGFCEIVKQAGMPAASAYHFSPNKSAIFMALAERYFKHFVERASKHPIRPHSRWQDLVADTHKSSIAYYNTHKAAMKLILGAQPFLELQLADSNANRAISAQTVESFRSMYEMPQIRDMDRKFLIAVAISDGSGERPLVLLEKSGPNLRKKGFERLWHTFGRSCRSTSSCGLVKRH